MEDGKVVTQSERSNLTAATRKEPFLIDDKATGPLCQSLKDLINFDCGPGSDHDKLSP